MQKKLSVAAAIVLLVLGGAAYWVANHGNPQWHWRLYAHQSGNGEIDLAPPSGYTGRWNKWDGEGRVLATYSYRDGKRNGPYVVYGSDGEPASSGQYLDGLLDGVQTVNQPGGAVTAIPYKMGRRDGVETTTYASGQVAVEAPWVDDVQQGVVLFYYENGMRQAGIPFYDGKIEGVQQTWHEDGSRESEETYRGSLKEGPSLYWGPAGNIEMRLNFRDDAMDGVQTWYYPDGRPSREMELAAGVPEGRWREWDESGALTVDQFYKGGVLDNEYVPEEAETP